jgi:N-acetyl-beta-hexosaminidase
MLETVILGSGKTEIDIEGLKKSVKDLKTPIKDDKDFEALETDLFKKHAKQITTQVSAGIQPVPKISLPQPSQASVKKEEKTRAAS